MKATLTTAYYWLLAVLAVVLIVVGIATYGDHGGGGAGGSDPRNCSPGARVAVECDQ